jgi:hypothetical protein
MSGLVHVNAIRTCLTMALLGSLWVGATATATAQDSPVARSAPERVLFLGNSHTARHGGIDWLVGNMVRAGDPSSTYQGTARTESGETLQYHYENGAPDAIRLGEFDTVVLQGHLPAAATQTSEPFLEYARLLDREIDRAGAQTVFFMTWPQGRLEWADLDDIIAAHRRISAELDAPVAPAGVAFEMARAERPDLELIGEDEIHATWEGAYLAAVTIYATLYDRSPVGLSYTFGVDADDAAFLQRIAWQAITDWQSGD